MWSENAIKKFGGNIQLLIEKKDLSRQQSYDMFKQVLLNQQPDLQQGAFLAALTSKGETPQEIAGGWQAIVELDTTAVSRKFEAPLVENSGTGMDRLKTFNVSSAAAIVAAAGGVRGRYRSVQWHESQSAPPIFGQNSQSNSVRLHPEYCRIVGQPLPSDACAQRSILKRYGLPCVGGDERNRLPAGYRRARA
jgi:hypothetical protein